MMKARKIVRQFALILGSLFALLGLGVTGLICASGSWGLGHMWPVLLISIPLLLIGVWLVRAGVKSASAN
jgi:hypothetical protein